MFSDHLRKISEVPRRTLLGVAACFVILLQLGAMAMVADGQMKKAQARATLLTSERIAAAHCMERSMGAARHSCVQQARAESLSFATVDYSLARPSGQAVASNTDVDDGALAIPQMRDFRPVLLAPR